MGIIVHTALIDLVAFVKLLISFSNTQKLVTASSNYSAVKSIYL